jgi:hypothetical protein
VIYSWSTILDLMIEECRAGGVRAAGPSGRLTRQSSTRGKMAHRQFRHDVRNGPTTSQSSAIALGIRFPVCAEFV